MKKLLLTLSILSLINGADPFPNNDPQYDEVCKINALQESASKGLKEISEFRKNIHNFQEANLDALLGDVRVVRERTPHELALERFWNTPVERRKISYSFIKPVSIKKYYIDGDLVTCETIF